MVVNINFTHKMSGIEVSAKVYLGSTSARGDNPDVVLEIEASDCDGEELPRQILNQMEEQALEQARYAYA